MHYQFRPHGGGHACVDGERLTFGHMRSVRAAATEWALRAGVPVVIERVTDGPLPGRVGMERGRDTPEVKAVLVISAEGVPGPPPKVELSGPVKKCRKGQAGACFCINCKAERAAK